MQRAYELGTRTVTDLLAADTKLFNSLRDYESARYDYVIELISLSQLRGGLTVSTIKKIMQLMIESNERDPQPLVPKHLLTLPKV
ncbi:TolC family protein (plasmid) [Vibrio sp. SS-MA-C1-2]|uniref:TolC family protein n=1 Tax=Vibrio sp. SS-MA-C1-2 TaxID=2908646 RepID=UPI001F44ABB4|nr:TolC family protein [Vibrio sp. SS-MA-C1-2]UJF20372.1 TolC family protein [Vibrio sp. SS-MA-C1-2]